MGAPVGHAAAGVVAERPKAPLGQRLVVGPPRRGAEPHLPVEPVRDRLLRQVALAGGAAAGDEDRLDLSAGAAPDQPRPVAVVAEHALAAAGEDPAVTADRLDHGPAFADGQALGLLTINVLAGPTGGDGDQ